MSRFLERNYGIKDATKLSICEIISAIEKKVKNSIGVSRKCSLPMVDMSADEVIDKAQENLK